MNQKHVCGKKISNLAFYLPDKSNFLTVSYTMITDRENKIGDFYFFQRTNQPKYFEIEIFVKWEIKK